MADKAPNKIVAVHEMVIGQVEHRPGVAKPGKTFMPGDELVGVTQKKMKELLAQGLAREVLPEEPDLIDDKAGK